jgi:hypothetical protein
LDSSIIQGPFSVAPCQTLISITIRNFFIAVGGGGGVPLGSTVNPQTQLFLRARERAHRHSGSLPSAACLGPRALGLSVWENTLTAEWGACR